jgi:hypothetical protein
MRDMLKTVPVTRVTTLADQVDSNIVPERLIATLAESFGVLGLALAGIGLHGLLAYIVPRRTNEIGIRMALRATTAGVSRLVLRDCSQWSSSAPPRGRDGPLGRTPRNQPPL